MKKLSAADLFLCGFCLCTCFAHFGCTLLLVVIYIAYFGCALFLVCIFLVCMISVCFNMYIACFTMCFVCFFVMSVYMRIEAFLLMD